jgi:hypothetical protein
MTAFEPDSKLEQILCDYLREHGIRIERRTTLEKLEMDQNATVEEGSYPVQVKIRRDSEEGISRSVIRCS